MSALHPARNSERNWLRVPVSWLDDRLRSRQRLYQYSARPGCLFRIRRGEADADITFVDGSRVYLGDPVLDLHLWNEHMPRLDARHAGPGLAWARLLGREIAASLRELAVYMAADPSYHGVTALRADMRLGTAAENAQIVRLSARYGFVRIERTEGKKQGALRNLGENILGLLLILAFNPAAARFAVLRRDSVLIYMSRARLNRYLPRRSDANGR